MGHKSKVMAAPCEVDSKLGEEEKRGRSGSGSTFCVESPSRSRSRSRGRVSRRCPSPSPKGLDIRTSMSSEMHMYPQYTRLRDVKDGSFVHFPGVFFVRSHKGGRVSLEDVESGDSSNMRDDMNAVDMNFTREPTRISRSSLRVLVPILQSGIPFTLRGVSVSGYMRAEEGCVVLRRVVATGDWVVTLYLKDKDFPEDEIFVRPKDIAEISVFGHNFEIREDGMKVDTFSVGPYVPPDKE